MPNTGLQPTAFGAGMPAESFQLSLWLLERVLPESAADALRAPPRTADPPRRWTDRRVSAHGSFRA